MRIAVLGGAGLTGQAAVRNLVENKKVSEVLVGDINQKALDKVSEKIKSNKLTLKQVDVTDVEKTAELLKGFDVVINAVQYYFNIPVMQAALKARVNYVDHGGLYHVTIKQLELDSLFKSSGLVALVGMGAQPGITNVVARHASEYLDKMFSVLIRDGSRDFTEDAPPFVVTWSLQTLFDEMVMDAVIYEDGELKTVPALSRCETVDFPDPIGRMDTYVTIHSEIATLPSSFKDKGLRRCDWMEGSPDLLFIKMLADIGFAESEDIEINSTKVNPRNFLLTMLDKKGWIGYPENVTPNDWEITRVIIEGERLGKPVKKIYDITIPPKPEWRMSSAQIGVGIPSSTTAVMIAEGHVKEKGVIPPEKCIDPEYLFNEIGKHGIKIMEDRKELLN